MSQDAKTQADRSPSQHRPETDPHTQLGDRYILGDEIARGGMGRVVDATDTLLERNVAVKQALTLESDILRRFQRETKITARLEHPSIVPVYDAGRSDDGTPFYVMRKVSGRPLSELVGTAENLDQRLALLPNLLAATQAIAHAHARGVIHRDLKPSNILVGDLGETVVIDWGLAKVIGEPDEHGDSLPIDAGNSLRTRVGTVVGTPGFMAPEQLEAKDVDARADVYALGATLYYTLARKPPHASASEDEMMAAALAGPPTPLEKLVPDVPAELTAICDKALAFDDHTRYEDASQLANDLDRYLRGKLVAAHAYTARERIVRFVVRHRAPVIVGTIAAVVLAVMAVVSVRGVIAARDEAISQRTLAVAAVDRETARANDLTLAQARLLLDSDPRAALALVRPLARSPVLWRQARAIAADAREGGIPHRLVGATTTITVAMAPDGGHLAAVGDEGVVTVFDLRTRIGAVITHAASTTRLAWLDEGRLVLWDKTDPKLEILDLATRKSRAVAIAKPAITVAATDGQAWWIDTAGHAWHLATDDPQPIVIADHIRTVVPSPDGTAAVFTGDHGLWMTSAGAVEHVFDQTCFNVTWPTTNRMVAAVRRGYVDLQLEPRVATIVDREVTDFGIVVQDNHVYTAGLTGPRIDGQRPPSWPEVTIGGVLPSGHDAVVMPRDNAIVVFMGMRHQDLFSPLGEVDAIVASSASHFVVAIDRGQMFVWDLDEVLPKTIAVPSEPGWQLIGFGEHEALLTFDSKPGVWIDLATHAVTPAPLLPFGTLFSAPPAGDKILLVPLSDGPAILCRINATTCDSFEPGFRQTTFVDDHRFVAAKTTNEVVIYDTTTRKSEPLVPPGSAKVTFKLSPNLGWLVVGATDGTVRRFDLSTHATTTHHTSARKWSLRDLAIGNDGAVWIADDHALVRWTATTSSTHATFADRLSGFVVIDPHRAYAFTRGSEAFFVDLDRPQHLSPAMTLKSERIELALETGTLVLGREHGVTLLDVAANASTHLGRIMETGETADISLDGRFLYTFSIGHVSVFDVSVPQTPEATGAWIDAMAAP